MSDSVNEKNLFHELQDSAAKIPLHPKTKLAAKLYDQLTPTEKDELQKRAALALKRARAQSSE